MTLYEMKNALSNGKTIFDLPLKVSYYARVSTEKEEQLNSLENQVSFFEDYIQKNTIWTFVNGYVDEGISGTTSLKRENFMKMIEDSKHKLFDLILTKEVSRFSRDTIDSLLYTRKLLEYDVCVYFLSDNIITASPDGELRLTIMSSMAQDEVRKISERTKFGFKRALEKGTVLGTNNIWGYTKENGKLIIDEAEASLVRFIFETYANNTKIGLKKLSAELEKQGYYNRNGNPFHPNTLKHILQNPKYKGYFTGGLSTVIDFRSKKRNFYTPAEWKMYLDYNKVPPIVSEALWEKANQKLLQRTKHSKGKQKYSNTYPLSGKIVCEKHGCHYVRKVKHFKNKQDCIGWTCSHYHHTGKKDCFLPFIEESTLYSLLASIFKSFDSLQTKIVEQLLAFYREAFEKEKHVSSIEDIQKSLEKLYSQKERLLDLALDGILEKQDFSTKKRKIDAEISKTKDCLNLSNTTQKDFSTFLPSLKETILKLSTFSLENINNYIDTLLDNILVLDSSDFCLKITLCNHKTYTLSLLDSSLV